MRSEINVTPIIDVMLVLLILFMVMTPLSQTGVDVNLPETAAARSKQPSREIVLSIDEHHVVTINRKRVARDELPLLIRELFEARLDKSLFVKAHGSLHYGEVMRVLDVARGNAVERFGIVPL